MIDAERQLREDRLLRDSAKALFLADVDRIKADFEAKTLGKRAFDRAKDGASELLESAQAKAGDNVGIVALLFGAVALWFARHPVLSAFAGNDGDEQDESYPHTGEET